MIKRCNDFGAGGVSVAIGELADGLYIDLNKVPKKYDGLDGTELAISESQERMAVVAGPGGRGRVHCRWPTRKTWRPPPWPRSPRSRAWCMRWNGMTIVRYQPRVPELQRRREASSVAVPNRRAVWQPQWLASPLARRCKHLVGDLNVCSQKGPGRAVRLHHRRALPC